MSEKEVDRTCFTVMPFGGWYDEYYKTIYKPAIAEAGLMPTRADDLSRTSTIINDIWTYTKEATIVLADLTEENPNVFYELGLAHALAKPVVLIASSIDEVPFDLRALRVLVYDRNAPHWGDLLKKNIVKAIGELLVAPKKSILPTFLTVDDSPARPVVSGQEQELLQLRSEFEAFRREFEARSITAHPLRFIDVGIPTERHSRWSRQRERELMPEFVRQIASGLRKKASEESIVKRLVSLGAPEDVAWMILRNQEEAATQQPNQDSHATSEPAPSAASSAHEG